MKHLKLLLAYIIIFIISVFFLGYGYEYIGNNILGDLYSVFHFLLVLSLYIVSGYFITKKTEKFQLKRYWIIALIGICIWFAAYINSPTDLDWKKGNGSIIWLYYHLYIVPTELPFCFSNLTLIDKPNIIIKHIVLICFSIIPSVMQAVGGFLKTKRNIKQVS